MLQMYLEAGFGRLKTRRNIEPRGTVPNIRGFAQARLEASGMKQLQGYIGIGIE